MPGIELAQKQCFQPLLPTIHPHHHPVHDVHHARPHPHARLVHPSNLRFPRTTTLTPQQHFQAACSFPSRPAVCTPSSTPAFLRRMLHIASAAVSLNRPPSLPHLWCRQQPVAPCCCLLYQACLLLQHSAVFCNTPEGFIPPSFALCPKPVCRRDGTAAGLAPFWNGAPPSMRPVSCPRATANVPSLITSPNLAFSPSYPTPQTLPHKRSRPSPLHLTVLPSTPLLGWCVEGSHL